MIQLSFVQLYFLLVIFTGIGIIIGHLITKTARLKNRTRNPYQERDWDIGAYSEAWWDRENSETNE